MTSNDETTHEYRRVLDTPIKAVLYALFCVQGYVVFKQHLHWFLYVTTVLGVLLTFAATRYESLLVTLLNSAKVVKVKISEDDWNKLEENSTSNIQEGDTDDDHKN